MRLGCLLRILVGWSIVLKFSQARLFAKVLGMLGSKGIFWRYRSKFRLFFLVSIGITPEWCSGRTGFS